MPKVSILTPMKNAASWIGDTISSVRAQTFSDWEMIIIDDQSSDLGPDIAKMAAQFDERIKFVRNTGRHGAAGARNFGLEQAKGQYIAFLDADDLWDKNRLRDHIDFIDLHDLAFSWCSYRVQSDANRGIPLEELPVRHAKTEATRADLLSKKAPIGCLTAIYNQDKIGKHPMPVTLPTQEDFVLWAHIAQIIESDPSLHMKGLDQVLATYRLRGQSLSSDKVMVAKRHWSVLREHCGATRFEAAKYFALYAVRGVADRARLSKHNK